MFLSREFKHDETNRAWWTGKWYGRGLGSHVMSQPAREFVVKIVELSLWSSDFLIGHFLLFMLTLPMLVPYADRIHATSTFFLFLLVCVADIAYSAVLAASIQADPPAAVLAQAEAPTQKHRMCTRGSISALLIFVQVMKYGFLYIVVLCVFAALIAGRASTPSLPLLHDLT